MAVKTLTRTIRGVEVELTYDEDEIKRSFMTRAAEAKGGIATKRDGIIRATPTTCQIDVDRLFEERAPRTGTRWVAGGLFKLRAKTKRQVKPKLDAQGHLDRLAERLNAERRGRK